MSNPEITKPKPPRKAPPMEVLGVRGIVFEGKAENSISLSGVDFRVREGEILMLHIERHLQTREFVSMLQGLSAPQSGEVYYRRKLWKDFADEIELKMRHTTGRVFSGNAWVQNLTVHENVSLTMQHWNVSETVVEKEIAEWCECFELKRVSPKRPGFLDSTQLQLHQWVRAFAGKPKLILLERPMQFVSSEMLPKLIKGVNLACKRGCAVLWITANRHFAREVFGAPVEHHELRGNMLPLLKGVQS